MSPRPGSGSGATSLKGKALQYLSQREHSRKELAQKLQRWQATQAEVQARWQAAQVTARTAAGLELDTADDALHSGAPADPSAGIDEVLNGLAEAGLLSDTRFTESRVHARRARFGNRRIEQELKHHGVAATAEQLEQLRLTETQRALAVLRSRSSLLTADLAVNRRQWQRLQRFLAGRGFTSEAIQQALRQLGSPDEFEQAD